MSKICQKHSDVMRQILKFLTPSNIASMIIPCQTQIIALFLTHQLLFLNSSSMSLHALGLNPVIEAPWSAGATRHPRTSVLKFAIVKELEQFLIFFRFVPDVQPYGNYTEMFMYNMLKNNEPLFCRNLNVSRTCHSLYENNEAVLNSSGYSFQAYKITTTTKPTCQVLLLLGNALCDTLNSICKIVIQCMLKKTTCFG